MNTSHVCIFAPYPDKNRRELGHLEYTFRPLDRRIVHNIEDACDMIRQGTRVVFVVLARWESELVQEILSSFPKTLEVGFLAILLSEQDLATLPSKEIVGNETTEIFPDCRIWSRPIVSTKSPDWRKELSYYIQDHNKAIKIEQGR